MLRYIKHVIKVISEIPEMSKIEWIKIKAENGTADIQYQAATFYEQEQDKENALKYYLSAATRGHIGAQIRLGNCYMDGKLVDLDEKEAVYWFSLAAEHGNPDALYILGTFYYPGAVIEEFENALGRKKGREYDIPKAIEHLEKAAHQGHLGAQEKLANGIYYHHKSVYFDLEKAIYWFTKAAMQGSSWAQTQLGMIYQFEEKNDKRAIHWYQQAANSGQEIAIKALRYYGIPVGNSTEDIDHIENDDEIG